MGTRALKGQDTEISYLVDGTQQDMLKLGKDFSASFDMEKITEHYLGRTTADFDAVFNGCSGDATFHCSKPTVFSFIQVIVAKARSREPGAIVNVRSTFNFPDGGRARIVFRDVQFGAFPFSVPGRVERASIKVSWSCSEFQILPS